MFSIDAIMSTNLVTVPPSATLAEARTLMQDNNIHHLPVADDGGVVGLVTITNVLAATDSFLRDDRHRIHANEIIVGDVMVKDVATVDVNASQPRIVMARLTSSSSQWISLPSWPPWYPGPGST